MAEAVGLAIALAGLFNDAIECFQYVSIGRDFEDSLTTEQIKLHNAELRLSRWGKSVGLSGDIRDLNGLENATLSSPSDAQDLQAGVTKLQHIISLLEKASTKSTKYSTDQKIGGNNDTIVSKLSADMQRISTSRMSRALKAAQSKTKWALGGRDQVQQLVSSITEQIKDLEDLYPAPKIRRDALALEEVNKIDPPPDTISLLSESASSPEVQDHLLEAALRKKMEELPPNRTVFNSYFTGSNEGVQSSQITGGSFIIGAKGADIYSR